VRADVEAGTTLSAALATHPIAFDRLCVAMVNAGEAGGTLDDALSRVAVRLERDDRLRRSIKSALAYPTLIAGLAIAVMIGMMMFVIPVFGGMYRDLGSTLPLLTRAMLSTSGLLTSYWFVIFPSMVLMGWATLRFIRTELGRHVWDRAKLRLPLQMGAVVQKVVMARFSRTLATLVTCGVPILQAIDITGGTAGNAVIEQSMIAIRQRVRNGEALAVPLRSMPVFPPMVTQMIAVGEETGALDTMLHKVADFYEDEVEVAVKSLTSIIEPVMMIGVGAVVGVVVIGMYLPIFNMIQLVR
jgi:type IV pilus assembly protein PilC